MSEHILIVEDDDSIADVLGMNLEAEGYICKRVADGEAGLELALSGKFSGVILDIMIPKLSGTAVCKRIRDKNKLLPILMLTSMSEDIDKVIGFELGADDYMTKPFSVTELLMRIKALLRRKDAFQEAYSGKVKEVEMTLGGLKINTDTRTVLRDGSAIELSVTEFDLLTYLATNPGKVFSRDDLLEAVWGYKTEEGSKNTTVNSHMYRLRLKVEADPANPKYLLTAKGVGYKFAPVAEINK